MASVSRRQAESVLAAVKKQFSPWLQDGDRGPVLFKRDSGWVVIWEEGPYEWAIKDPEGDVDEEFGFRIPRRRTPKGVMTEPVNGYVLGIYPE